MFKAKRSYGVKMLNNNTITEEFEHGVVKSFDLFKGFGFITRKKGKDLFVFYNDIIDNDITFDEGAKVIFNVKNTPKGPRAINVSIVG